MDALKALRYVVQDKQRKSVMRIAVELAHCTIIEKEIPFYYFTSLLHKTNSGDYRKFIGHRRIRRITKNVFFNDGNHDDNSLLENKLEFGRYLSENCIPSPIISAHSTGFQVHTSESSVVVGSAEGLAHLISRLAAESDTGLIFVKPLDGIGGSHTFKFTDYCPPSDALLLFQLMSIHNFVFQEYIDQHSEVARVYDKSINSVRVHSYRDPNSKTVEIVSAAMRFGAGGAIVDNVTSDGFRVPVDIETWRLRGVGTSSLKSGGRTVERHPDSNYLLNGFQVPCGKEIEDLINSVAILFEKPFVGWDVALTSNGPMVIEGNPNPHLIGAQVACGGLRNSPGLMKVFKDFV